MERSSYHADFQIIRQSSDEQTVGGDTYTEWRWLVVPQESGDKELTLHITAVVNVAGFEKPRDVVVTSRRVKVKVNAKRWLMRFADAHADQGLAFLLGMAFAKGGGWLWNKLRSRKQLRASVA
jgi:hypothetical protein